MWWLVMPALRQHNTMMPTMISTSFLMMDLLGLDFEYQHRHPDACMSDVAQDRFVRSQKSLLFSSQDTPPTTFTEPPKVDILSPNTLCVVAGDAVKGFVMDHK
jgi:hypothetical protein